MMGKIMLVLGGLIVLLSSFGVARVADVGHLNVQMETPRPSQEFGAQSDEVLMLPVSVRTNADSVTVRVVKLGGGEIWAGDLPANNRIPITDPETLAHFHKQGFVDLVVWAEVSKSPEKFEIYSWATQETYETLYAQTEMVRVRFIRDPPVVRKVNFPKFLPNEPAEVELLVTTRSQTMALSFVLPHRQPSGKGPQEVTTTTHLVEPGEDTLISASLITTTVGSTLQIMGSLRDGAGYQRSFNYWLEVAGAGDGKLRLQEICTFPDPYGLSEEIIGCAEVKAGQLKSGNTSLRGEFGPALPRDEGTWYVTDRFGNGILVWVGNDRDQPAWFDRGEVSHRLFPKQTSFIGALFGANPPIPPVPKTNEIPALQESEEAEVHWDPDEGGIVLNVGCLLLPFLLAVLGIGRAMGEGMA